MPSGTANYTPPSGVTTLTLPDRRASAGDAVRQDRADHLEFDHELQRSTTPTPPSTMPKPGPRSRNDRARRPGAVGDHPDRDLDLDPHHGGRPDLAGHAVPARPARLREATRNSRAGLACETAADDTDTRNLFDRQSFTQTWYWTTINPFRSSPATRSSRMFAHRAHRWRHRVESQVVGERRQYRDQHVGSLPGLPFCYDPLWRSITNVMPNTRLSDPTSSFNWQLCEQRGRRGPIRRRLVRRPI